VTAELGISLPDGPERAGEIEPAHPDDHPSLLRLAGGVFGGATGTITITFVAVFLVGLFYVGSEFVGSANLSIVAQSVTVPLLIGTCSGYALLSGVVDLSIGSTAGLSAAIFAWLCLHHFGSWQAAGVVVLTGLFIGAVNALAVVVFGANTIAATLGMFAATSGVLYVVCGPNGALQVLVHGLYDFSNRPLGPVPLVFVLVFVLVLLSTYVVMLTRLGRHIRAVGGDEVAAKRGGLAVRRIRIGAFLLSGLGASLGGLLYMGQLGGVTNTLGFDLAFQVYAALMIGGYSIIRGGVGNPIGGALGMLVVAGVTDIITVKSINTYYTDVIVGVLLIAAVFLDRLRGGDAFE
jgi:ribose/xylose/arabinose/galactoside ABC-type transport system permease subunit